ncbi:MAG: hypothetical protein IT373_36880 [Polyangiaceae bacterium]|nr:hypothetical protein [Polyangiaceae bacterium]
MWTGRRRPRVAAALLLAGTLALAGHARAEQPRDSGGLLWVVSGVNLAAGGVLGAIASVMVAKGDRANTFAGITIAHGVLQALALGVPLLVVGALDRPVHGVDLGLGLAHVAVGTTETALGIAVAARPQTLGPAGTPLVWVAPRVEAPGRWAALLHVGGGF